MNMDSILGSSWKSAAGIGISSSFYWITFCTMVCCIEDWDCMLRVIDSSILAKGSIGMEREEKLEREIEGFS